MMNLHPHHLLDEITQLDFSDTGVNLYSADSCESTSIQVSLT